MLAEALTMISITLIGACLLFAFPAEPPLRAHDLETYQALRAKAGKDAQAQVKLALWCEAHGLNYERLKHLAQAVLSRQAAIGRDGPACRSVDSQGFLNDGASR
jgi:hypothetical protein